MAEDSDSKPRVMPKSTRTLWEQGHFIDFKIIVEGRKFSVHKVVMAGMSGHFRTLLTGSQKDSVELEGLSACTMEILIDCIYCKDINITQKNVSEILSGAVQLQIQAAVQVCARFMIDNLDVNNCCFIHSLFRRFDLKEGVKEVEIFMKWQSCEIVKACDLLEVQYDAMSWLIKHWENSEWDLFLFINKWLSVKYTERKGHLDQLLEEVHYQLLTPARLLSIKKMDIYKDSDAIWCILVDEALEYHELPLNHRVSAASDQSETRDHPSVVLFTTDAAEQVGCYFDAHKHCFNEYPSLKTPQKTGRIYSQIVVNNFLIVCMENTDEEEVSNGHQTQQWYIFDPRTLQWSKMANLPRFFHQGALVHESVYVYAVGGTASLQDDHTYSSSIERYNFRTDRWRSFATLRNLGTDQGACVMDGKLYISGGVLQGEPQKSMDSLTLSTKKWTAKAPMLALRSEHWLNTMEIRGEKVLSILDARYRLECYNPVSNQWTMCVFTFERPLPLPFEELRQVFCSNNEVFLLQTWLGNICEEVMLVNIVLYFPTNGLRGKVFKFFNYEAKDADDSKLHPAILSILPTEDLLGLQ